MSNLSPLDYFGRFICEKLRDPSIDRFDRMSRRACKSPALQSLQGELSQFSAEQIDVIRRCVVSSVDAGIHDLLFAIQEQADFDTRLSIRVDGVEVVEESDGLQGETFNDEGWFARYSAHGEKPEND